MKTEWEPRRHAVQAMMERDRIDELADRLEIELGTLETFWSEIPDDERAVVIRRIGAHAPGIARLLCPQFERFGIPFARSLG